MSANSLFQLGMLFKVMLNIHIEVWTREDFLSLSFPDRSFSSQRRVSAGVVLTLLSALMCCRKNWTSSWTVLQGSTLLFAKSQGGGTSWVSPTTRRKSERGAEGKVSPVLFPLSSSVSRGLELFFFSVFPCVASSSFLSSSLSLHPSPRSHTTTVAPSLNSSCLCWPTGGHLLRNTLPSPLAARSSVEPPLYVLPPLPLHAATILSFTL